jgi:hypothetical protein
VLASALVNHGAGTLIRLSNSDDGETDQTIRVRLGACRALTAVAGWDRVSYPGAGRGEREIRTVVCSRLCLREKRRASTGCDRLIGIHS